VTISNFHGLTLKIKVTDFLPPSDNGAHARPGSGLWAQPPEPGYVEFDVVGIEPDEGLQEAAEIIRAHNAELTDIVFEIASSDDGYEG
jgi:hypothetical protein